MIEALIALRRWCLHHNLPMPEVTFRWPSLEVAHQVATSLSVDQQWCGRPDVENFVRFRIADIECRTVWPPQAKAMPPWGAWEERLERV